MWDGCNSARTARNWRPSIKKETFISSSVVPEQSTGSAAGMRTVYRTRGSRSRPTAPGSPPSGSDWGRGALPDPVSIWDTKRGRRLGTFPGRSEVLGDALFSPTVVPY